MARCVAGCKVARRGIPFPGDTDESHFHLNGVLARNRASVGTRIMLAATVATAGDPEAAERKARAIRLPAPGRSLAGRLETPPLARGRLNLHPIHLHQSSVAVS